MEKDLAINDPNDNYNSNSSTIDSTTNSNNNSNSIESLSDTPIRHLSHKKLISLISTKDSKFYVIFGNLVNLN